MKYARLLHNPEAGEADLTKNDLVSLIEAEGFECSYSSTKKKRWEKLEAEQTDFLILAGGDGTVRKVAEELLEKKLLDKPIPIALLPFGTANNIAKTLKITGTIEEIVESWKTGNVKKYDVARIHGLKKVNFFLESFGIGVFPYLIKEMKKQNQKNFTAEESINIALKLLLQLIPSYESHYCKIQIDGVDYSGNFILIEVMNTSSIGPNLFLAPEADPGDGQLDIVLIPDKQRDDFSEYIESKIKGVEAQSAFKILKAKNLQLYCDELLVHVDDENIEIKKAEEIKIEVLEGLLNFLVPGKQ